jgi:hypothetical protein
MAHNICIAAGGVVAKRPPCGNAVQKYDNEITEKFLKKS